MKGLTATRKLDKQPQRMDEQLCLIHLIVVNWTPLGLVEEAVKMQLFSHDDEEKFVVKNIANSYSTT